MDRRLVNPIVTFSLCSPLSLDGVSGLPLTNITSMSHPSASENANCRPPLAFARSLVFPTDDQRGKSLERGPE
ncbi:hypothetical protein NECAME_14353 [Necator americanus]|uniref:Uncharacterized protein n=1 Tax=Necator americanus TaxID=51031 RepID=W2SNH4_NECAM|nr:hypothetical protein NECAME_14353 [Necator americanus]ETN71088.1 hypothetical protein NECAME_14353 [Necator americanus]